MIINRVSDTDSSKYLDDKGLAELVTQIKTYANTHGGSVTVETLKQATVDVSTYNPANKPVVNPTSPNDAMAQVEVTLNNIPVPTDVENTKQATIDVSTYDPLNKPVINPTYPKEAMAHVEVTLDNIPAIEASKQVTVDVSTYDPSNKPIVTPTSPNDAMEEVEIILTNIPQNGTTLYCWHVNDPLWSPGTGISCVYASFDISPTDTSDLATKKGILIKNASNGDNNSPLILCGELKVITAWSTSTNGQYRGLTNFTRVSDTEFSFDYLDVQNVTRHTTYTRHAAGDISVW